jgi:hypothetical protein
MKCNLAYFAITTIPGAPERVWLWWKKLWVIKLILASMAQVRKLLSSTANSTNYFLDMSKVYPSSCPLIYSLPAYFRGMGYNPLAFSAQSNSIRGCGRLGLTLSNRHHNPLAHPPDRVVAPIGHNKNNQTVKVLKIASLEG